MIRPYKVYKVIGDVKGGGERVTVAWPLTLLS
jgi:hypothetical protein